MFFENEKFAARVRELQDYRYRQVQDLTGWLMKEDTTKEEKYPPKTTEGFVPFNQGDNWEGRDVYYWAVNEVAVPESTEMQLFLFDFGKTGGGGNSGFEALFFINGEPYQGVDQNHKEVLIDKKYYGQTISVALKLWSGLEGGGVHQIQRHRFERAQLATLDRDVDQLYFTAGAMQKAIVELGESNPAVYELSTMLTKTFQLINWSKLGSEAFYASLHAAWEYLDDALAHSDKKSLINFTALGHTHIDLAWLWRIKNTKEKGARSFSTVLRLMENYPEYKFLHTTPQLYAFIKEDYPEIYAEIKQKVQEGQWEIDGAMWVEADCNLPSGESLTRQIMYGAQFIKEEFNQDVSYLWLPDVFGYSWALPQILAKTNIKTFMTTKISWNQFNRMPHDTFWWKGIDGSEVLTHFVTTPEPGNTDHNSWFYTYNGLIEPETLMGSYEGYQDKEVNSDLLVAYGYGDGGGGVNREMLENIRAIDRIPGMPNVKTGTGREYFDKLHETFEGTDKYVHTWDGELYLEYHRGTYTSQAYIKKMNRKLELKLRELEILYAQVGINNGVTYPKEQIATIWKRLLKNQFHDIIPGSSIHEVYADVRADVATSLAEIDALMAEMKAATEEDAWFVPNTSGWTRGGLVTIPETAQGYFTTACGEILPTVKSDTGYTVEMKNIPSLTAGKIVFHAQDEAIPTLHQEAAWLTTTDNGLESNNYIIEWNEAGKLTRVYDKTQDFEVIKENGLGNNLVLFEDKPLNFNAWDIDIFYKEKATALTADKIEVAEVNPLYAVVSFHYTFGDSTIEQQMTLYKSSKRIDFKTVVDWHEQEQLLKTQFDVNIRSTEATYDIQYGNVKRPTNWNTSWEMAKFESVAHQWVDFSEKNYGVSLLNDSKYGHTVKDSTMEISLLKSANYPDPEADQGEQIFTYSLYPHAKDFVEGQTVEAAWEVNQPLYGMKQNVMAQNLFELPVDQHVCIDAMKQTEDGKAWVIRLHDHTGGTRKLSLTPQMPVKCWCETNLLEEGTSECSTEAKIDFTLAPYEIKTFKITLK